MNRDAELMEYGRALIKRGRHWLNLSDREIEHGARCVVADPIYRSEVAGTALRHVTEKGDAVEQAIVREAWDRLNERAGKQ
jgi:hypothetical protein